MNFSRSHPGIPLSSILAVLLFIAPVAITTNGSFATAATIDSFSITSPGGSIYREENLTGQRLTDQGGMADFLRNGAAPDHLFQNWWWYRTDNTGHNDREYALSNQFSGVVNVAGDKATLVYFEDQLRITLEYSWQDDRTVRIEWELLNRELFDPVNGSFFSYTDWDLRDTPNDDAGSITAISQFVTDGPITALVTAVQNGPNLIEHALFSTTVDKLADGNVDNLGPAPPNLNGDVTVAFQWNFNLAVQGSEGDRISGVLLKRVVPEPSTALLLGSGLLLLAAHRARPGRGNP